MRKLWEAVLNVKSRLEGKKNIAVPNSINWLVREMALDLVVAQAWVLDTGTESSESGPGSGEIGDGERDRKSVV